MKSLFEEMGGTYRQEGDYLIPNLALPDEPEYQIGKYGRMRRTHSIWSAALSASVTSSLPPFLSSFISSTDRRQ